MQGAPRGLGTPVGESHYLHEAGDVYLYAATAAAAAAEGDARGAVAHANDDAHAAAGAERGNGGECAGNE